MLDRNRLTKTVVARGMLWISVFTVLSRVSRFIGTIILVRLLTPGDFGLFYLGFSMINMFQLLRLPLGSAVVQRLNQEGVELEGQERIIGTTFSLKIIFGALAFLLAWVMIPQIYLGMGSGVDIGRVLSLTIPLLSLGEMPRILLNWQLKMKEESSVDLAREASFVCVSLFLAWQGYGAWSLVYGEVMSQTTVLVVSWLLSPRPIAIALDMREARELARYALFLTMASLLGWVTSQSDQLILGTVSGASVLGYYVVALSLMTTPVQLAGYMDRVVYPSLCRLQVDKERLSKAVETVLVYTLTLAIPFAFAAFTLADPIMPVLYTRRWLPAVPIVRFLVLLPITECTLNVLKSMFLAIGKPKLVFGINFARSAVFLILAIPFTYQWGPLGVAAALVVSSLTDVIVCLWYSRDAVRFRPRVGVQLASAFMMSLILFLIVREVEVNLLLLLPLVGLGMLIYTTGLWVLGGKDLLEDVWRVVMEIYRSRESGYALCPS